MSYSNLQRGFFLNTFSLQEAAANLSQVIAETIENSEETLIVSNKGSVIMIDKDYWEEIQETLRLLRDKKSLTALLEGQQQRERGITPSGKTISELFDDLQD